MKMDMAENPIEKKKILFMASTLEIDGIVRSLIGLLSAFDYEKYSVDLFLFCHKGELLPLLPPQVNLLPENPWIAIYEKSIHELLAGGKPHYAAIRLAAKIEAKFTCRRLKVNNVGYYSWQYLMRWLVARLPPFTQEYHCAISYRPPHHLIAYKVKARRKIAFIRMDYSKEYVDLTFELPSWSQYDNIAAVSAATASRFSEVFRPLADRVCAIESIVSTEFVQGEAAYDVSAEMPDEDGIVRLCTVARLSHAKAIDRAVMICRRLLDAGCGIKWYVVGYGPDEEMIRGLITQYDMQEHFILLGKKTNPYPYIRACDIYVQPSRSEGKAVAVREAQILCKPVVITNYPTASSQLRDGYDGVIVPMELEGCVAGMKAFI